MYSMLPLSGTLEGPGSESHLCEVFLTKKRFTGPGKISLNKSPTYSGSHKLTVWAVFRFAITNVDCRELCNSKSSHTFYFQYISVVVVVVLLLLLLLLCCCCCCCYLEQNSKVFIVFYIVFRVAPLCLPKLARYGELLKIVLKIVFFFNNFLKKGIFMGNLDLTWLICVFRIAQLQKSMHG